MLKRSAVCRVKPSVISPVSNRKRFSFRQQIRSYVYTGIFRESVVQFPKNIR
ncbi:MAG: hypothetical protein ACLRSW_14170 [Christensenellaceae bacterium]